MPLLAVKKTRRQPLGAECDPHQQTASQCGAQSYTQKELNSATALKSLKVKCPPRASLDESPVGHPLWF